MVNLVNLDGKVAWVFGYYQITCPCFNPKSRVENIFCEVGLEREANTYYGGGWQWVSWDCSLSRLFSPVFNERAASLSLDCCESSRKTIRGRPPS